ncbi:MAG: nickel pincer cofactor biosynthesis protein LarB [Candidatus Omnitrophota bacterium]|jgi:NCAIR mutase (PurE)-related protein
MALNKGFCDLGFAKVDLDRCRRRGIAEVIYCPGKDRKHLKKICSRLIKSGQNLLLTRLDKKTYLYLKKSNPHLKYNILAKIAFLNKKIATSKKGSILIVSAGTSDLAVAEEAAVTAQVLGNKVKRLYDVGVAGVHRLIHNIGLLKEASVIVVVAGMEGALPSIVSGMVAVPVVAVPTSCGYGANFAGLSSLLTMLNSCSPGIGVVNIDNGFGAGYLAALINR